MVKARLSDVPLDLRQKVADELVRREKLRGIAAAEILIAAFTPPEVALRVPAWKLELVRAGKRPPGPTPKYA